VIDTVPAVINVKNRELRYVLMNRYMAGILRHRAGGRDRPYHNRPDVAYGAQKPDEKRQARAGQGQRLGSTRRNTSIHPAICGNGWSTSFAVDARGEIENIVTVALDIGERKRGRAGDTQGQDAAESALRKFAGNPEFADRGGEARSLGCGGSPHEVNIGG